MNQGGAVAAPVAGQILSEVLPYLETEKQEEKEKVEVPNIEGMTINEAKKVLKDLELELKISNSYDGMKQSEVIIKEQLPKEGIIQEKGGYIVCEIE